MIEYRTNNPAGTVKNALALYSLILQMIKNRDISVEKNCLSKALTVLQQKEIAV
jgi:hypothetical protein